MEKTEPKKRNTKKSKRAKLLKRIFGSNVWILISFFVPITALIVAFNFDEGLTRLEALNRSLSSNVYSALYSPIDLSGTPVQVKLFIRNGESIEKSVNDWLSAASGVTVGQIKVSGYGGDYVVMAYFWESDKSSTSVRVKVFDSAALGKNVTGPENNLEDAASRLILSIGDTYRIRSVDFVVSTGPWDMFVVYDDPVQESLEAGTESDTSEPETDEPEIQEPEQSPEQLEDQFPTAQQSGSEQATPEAQEQAPTEQSDGETAPVGETTPSDQEAQSSGSQNEANN